jgi:hypothetical protein
MITIQDVYTQVNELARQIGAAAAFLPTFGTSDLSGKPYIVIKGETFYYLAWDRGAVTLNRQTDDLQELLYWIFADITYQMGVAYEAEHRVPDLDPRRLAFKKQLDLLDGLQPSWKALRQEEIRDILVKHPYRDELRAKD